MKCLSKFKGSKANKIFYFTIELLVSLCVRFLINFSSLTSLLRRMDSFVTGI
jgi:hypothetical protein